MLAFTPEVESALRWFDLTHTLVTDFGRARFQRTSLPGPGSIADHDAKLIEALEMVRYISDECVNEARPKRKSDG